MFRFEPPRHDRSSFKSADLGAIGGLVQSLRWYNSRASLLLYFWGMHETIENEALKMSTSRPLSPDARYMLRRSVLHSVIIEVRALHDRDSRSLGSRQIAARLAEPETRAGLDNYLASFSQGRVMRDVDRRNQYLDYVQHYCSLMAPANRAPIPDHPLSSKVELVRRMANKSVAHSTLDDYTLGGEDLGDVVIASIAVACAIESAVGNAATSNDFAVVEALGYKAAGHLLHVEVDSSPYNVNMIRGLLPAWIKLGGEFPNYPSDFRR
jgi:hypothetical protein